MRRWLTPAVAFSALAGLTGISALFLWLAELSPSSPIPPRALAVDVALGFVFALDLLVLWIAYWRGWLDHLVRRKRYARTLYYIGTAAFAHSIAFVGLIIAIRYDSLAVFTWNAAAAFGLFLLLTLVEPRRGPSGD